MRQDVIPQHLRGQVRVSPGESLRALAKAPPPPPGYLVLGQLDLTALQVYADGRAALQLLRGVLQPLQKLLQLALELPQTQEGGFQLMLWRREPLSGLGLGAPTSPESSPQGHCPP